MSTFRIKPGKVLRLKPEGLKGYLKKHPRPRCPRCGLTEAELHGRVCCFCTELTRPISVRMDPIWT